MRSLTLLLLLAQALLLVRAQDLDDVEDDYGDEEAPVQDIPEFISDSEQSISVRAGDSLKMTCQVNAMLIIPMLWIKKDDTANDLQIALGGRILNKKNTPNVRVTSIHGNQGEMLVISPANITDSGTYYCQLNADEPKRLTFHVEVLNNGSAAPKLFGFQLVSLLLPLAFLLVTL